MLETAGQTHQAQSVAKEIMGLYETHLPVRDLERSVAFYRDIVGLELGRIIPGRKVAFFWAGGKETGMLGLWETGSAPLAMKLHFAFRMSAEGITHACEYLKAQGVQPLGFGGHPVDEPDVIAWMPAAVVYFKDPDGHSIEFLHVLEEPAQPELDKLPLSRWRQEA
ncbi:VOC family protein [Roseibium sp. RKSG952]|uniref:VOC family protein n=1 Tax=Roseibium sp. RKSG952 TaxID=2529384 RepID=UPI0012BCD6C0|nr:VOC family protein [Roseibium sp. RKSG952]MTH99445.1 VOC family protein [Roseibium sp. RKSG952]